MSIDISFWEPPNWKKESSMSPVFVGLLAVIVAIAIVGLYYLFLIQTTERYTYDLKSETAESLTLQKQYADLKQVQEYTVFLNKSILNPLIQQQGKILFASSLIQEFQKNQPKSIVLNKFSFDAFKSAVTKKGSKAGLRYRVILKGYAIGNNSENVVGDFVKKLRSQNQFKEKLISVAIQGRLNKVFSEDISTFKTVFSIDCTFEKEVSK